MPASESRVLLATPPVGCLVPDDLEPPVFDAFGWCRSDWLDWRRPTPAPTARDPWNVGTALDGSDPERMVFVFRRPCTFLPRELARLHAFGLGLDDEEALAPWAIDNATDELYARRVRPRDLLWLAADNLNALFWGLHDWAHFHNHGPFEQRAWTELQCDASALAWLWINRDAVPLGADPAAAWERLRLEALALSRRRFEEEGVRAGSGGNGDERLESVLSSARLRGLVDERGAKTIEETVDERAVEGPAAASGWASG